MLTIDQTLIGRHYYTVDPKTQYTLRGVADGTGTVIVIGEYESTQTETRLTTHKITNIHLIP